MKNNKWANNKKTKETLFQLLCLRMKFCGPTKFPTGVFSMTNVGTSELYKTKFVTRNS